MTSKASLIAVGLLTVIAFALRLAGIDQSIYGDERLLYNIVEPHGLGHVLHVVATTEKTPPLHFLLAWGAVHLGDPTIWIRLPSLVFGTATVPLVYLLGLRTVGRWPGLVAAALVALAPFSIYYGIENRAYATLTFVSALSTLTLLRALRRDRFVAWLAYGASTTAVLYIHYTGAFVVLAQLAWALYSHRDRVRQLVLVHVAVGLTFVAWLPSFFTQFDHSSSEGARLATRWPFSVKTIVDMFGHALPGYPFVSLRELPGRPVVVLVVTTIGIAMIAALLRLLRAVRERRRPLVPPKSMLVVVLALATPVGISLYSLRPDTSFLLSRNLSASVPALALLIGWLLTAFRPRLSMVAVAAVLGGVAVGAAKTLDHDIARPPYRQVAQLIDDKSRPGDAFINLPIIVFSRSALDPGYDLEIYFKQKHDGFTATQSDKAWTRAGRGQSVFVVSPWEGGHLSALGGPGNRFVLREEKVFPGHLPIAVGRYSGKLRAEVANQDGLPILRWSFGDDIRLSAEGGRGSVDKLKLVGRELQVIGWAADGQGRRPADWVLVFSGRRLLAIVKPAVPRPDVARAYSQGTLLSGFNLSAPTPGRYGPVRRSQIRVFAVAGNRGSELNGG
jgi:4-amino-4-deoxy-L-arabinose transferase-like glycosyltransferase